MLLQSCTANGRGDRGSKKKKKRYISLWDLNIPPELLQEILSRLRLKANIHASLVCKSWLEAAVSVRKLQPRPWLFYPLDERICDAKLKGFYNEGSPTETYILGDPLRYQTHKKLHFPELKNHRFSCSRDGWLLVLTNLIFLLNPFTGERIYLPNGSGYEHCLAFSAAPTSSSCLVVQLSGYSPPLIKTWHPGETLWTTHCFENQLPGHRWDYCVFSNGMFYSLSSCGHLGVFNPPRATWNILPVKPCPAFSQEPFNRRVLMMEHEGDIFVLSTRRKHSVLVFKLNLERKDWEEKTGLGGLTVFLSSPTSLVRAGLSVEERNRVYPSFNAELGVYYSHHPDKICPYPPWSNYLSNRTAWVDAPHKYVNL